EAGRGPVIGPLVICAFAVEREGEGRLREMGVKDSKLLPAVQREKIAKKIAHFPQAIVEVSAEEITEYMKRKISINEMEAEKIALALLELSKKVEISEVFADSPDPVAKKFETRIRKYLRGTELEKVKIVSENKADYKYPVVGAASILAKSMREKRVSELAAKFGEFGSGYPSDENTMEFLRKHYKEPALQKHIRHKWATMRNIRTTEVKLEDFF
ncbi:MAG: ribonuclease HII, partial [Candidatus Micrarchaeota archaeon]